MNIRMIEFKSLFLGLQLRTRKLLLLMRNAGLEEAQARIKIARRSINNLRYADEPPLWQKVKRN